MSSDHAALPNEALHILHFWFGASALQAPEQRKEWFNKSTKFDEAITKHFLSVYQRGVAGELESWRAAAGSALAYVLLFDQFPRNMFRGRTDAFATDAKALSCAKAAVAADFDDEVPPLARVFFYLPFEHSERMLDQRYSLKLFGRLAAHPGMETFVDYAKRHYAVVERFGRFPHRNDMLGRPGTVEELGFLKQPGSSF